MIDASKTVKSIDKIKSVFRLACMHAMQVAVREAEAAAKQTTSFYDRTGGTRQTIKGTAYADGLSGKLTGKKATRFLEFGTKDHGPVSSPYLVFRVNGHWVRTRFVRGIKAMRFMENAKNVGELALRHGLAYYLNKH